MLAGAHEPGLPSPRWYAVLWLVLGAMSVVVVLDPSIPIAGPNPPLAVAVATISSTVGFVLCQLRVLRFSVLGCALDLFVGLAFGTLALANLLGYVLVPAATTEPGRAATGMFLLFLARLLASLLFLVGLAHAQDVIPVEARTWYALRMAGALGAVLVLGGAVMFTHADLVPSALDPTTRAPVAARAVIYGPQLDHDPWAELASGSVGVLLLLATIGYSRIALRSGDWHVVVFAVALTLLCFSQLHTLMAGPLPADYVSTADVFRLTAYTVLLYHLVTRITGEIARRASGAERLRLSRELHDGLAQQLSLLNLCLERLARPERSAAQHAHDLQSARRLVEAAALEADQAITALRTGTVTWDAFCQAVSTFAEEFAENHEVEVQLATDGTARVLSAELQAEVLRILYEACSNAILHGAATRIDVRVAGSADWLLLRVSDNGSGFDLPVALTSDGVGIRSITERLQRRGGTLRLDSTPGEGALLEVSLPLRRHRLVGR